MIMNKRILYLLSVLCFFSFSACTSEEEPVLTEELGEIWLSVVDTSKVEVVTRALSGFDVKDFNVSLSRGETMVFSSRKYGDIAGSPITCSAGSGYLLTAESCTESEAERTNSGWGVGPRREMITPWSTNAVEITQNMSLNGISRIDACFSSSRPKAFFARELFGSSLISFSKYG